MTRTIFCRKYQRQMDGLPSPPFPGKRGEDIYQHISSRAWQEWLDHQTMLINEKHLNLMDLTARAYLNEQMEKFFSGDDVDRAEGYVPPSDDANS